MSSKTSTYDRLQRAQTIKQSDHGDLLDNNIKDLVKEWEGDPHDDQFWQKFEAGQKEAEQGRMRTLRGQMAQSKQLDVIEAQSNVFRNLREKEEMQSERNASMLGGFVQDRRNNPRLQNNRNSVMFGDTLQGEDGIRTELDAGDSVFKQLDAGDSIHRQLDEGAKQAQKILLKEHSAAILTDYDIADEVGAFNRTERTNLDQVIKFRDKNWVDPTKVDKNIEDLNRQIELENAQIERDQTHHIKDKKIENLVETPSHKPKPDPIESTVVNEFSGQGPAKKQNIEQFDEEEPAKPMLDSEDSGSYEKENGGQDNDEMEVDFLEPEQVVKEESENSSSADEVSEKREKKTIGRVTMYDDWLELQTQKEIAKQSQANQLQSPTSQGAGQDLGSDFKKEINKQGDRDVNMTQIIEPASKDDAEIMGSPQLKLNETLPQRPKTREVTIPMGHVGIDNHGRRTKMYKAIPIPMDPNSNIQKASKSPMITMGKPLIPHKAKELQSQEQLLGIKSDTNKSKASFSFLTSPQHENNSKVDDLVLSTSVPDIKSQLDATRKFKIGENDKNFTITEKVIEEKNEDNQSSLKELDERNEDNQSSLKEVSPLTLDSKKSVGKTSPQKPPTQFEKQEPIQQLSTLQEKISPSRKSMIPQKPPQSPLKLKNKLGASEDRFSLQPSQASIAPKEEVKQEEDLEENLNQTFGSPRPGQESLQQKLQQLPSEKLHSPPKTLELEKQPSSKSSNRKPRYAEEQQTPQEDLKPQKQSDQKAQPVRKSNLSSASKPPMPHATQQPPQAIFQDHQDEPFSAAKSQLNQTGGLGQNVQDFLQFEDSDDEDFAAIINKAKQEPPREIQTAQPAIRDVGEPIAQDVTIPDSKMIAEPSYKELQQPNIDEPTRVELSPQTRDKNAQFSKTKTPTIATASEPGLRNALQNVNTSGFIGPLDSQVIVPPKTPNTGNVYAKTKAKNIPQNKTMDTQKVSPSPPRMASEEERELNEQVNNIDYNVDQEGMSASYYRLHDAQLQRQLINQQSARSSQNMQNMQSSRGELTRPLGGVRHSESKQLSSSGKTELTEMVNNTANILEFHNKRDQYSGQKQSDEKRQVRASMIEMMKKNLTPTINEQAVQKPIERQNSRPRKLKKLDEPKAEADPLNTSTQSYKRPEGVRKMLTKGQRNSGMSIGKNDSLNESQISQPTEQVDKFVNQKIKDVKESAFRSNNSLRQPSPINSGVTRQHVTKSRQALDRQLKNRTEVSGDRKSSVDRLFNTETIASKMKRNPEFYGYNAKDKKPPAPPKRLKKKKSSVQVDEPPMPAPEPPFVPYEPDPTPYSPKRLDQAYEPSYPRELPDPGLPPLQMRLPEDPPTEPSSIITANLLQPLEPDVPDNDDVYPTALEFTHCPDSPRSMRLPLEPMEPALPERMLKSSTAEFWCEILEEPEFPEKPVEPEPEADPFLPYPMPTGPFTMPPAEPNAEEEPPLACLVEPEPEDLTADLLIDTEGALHYLETKELFVAKSIGVGPDKPSSGSQYEEFKEALQRNSNPFDIANRPSQEEEKKIEQSEGELDFELSDDDNFSVHSAQAPNKVTIGIQTSAIHFGKVEKSKEFQLRQKERIESTDWALSSLFDDISFAKQKKTIGGRKLLVQAPIEKLENCGNQVEQKQIIQETQEQILSQIECEYNADQLKRKVQGKDNMEDERLFELYMLGFSTLKALMLVLRLEKEWELQTKQQYEGVFEGLDLAASNRSVYIDPEDTIKLLTRCKKMYEAKTSIQRLLKMIVERDQMVEEAQMIVEQDGQSHGPQKAKESLDKIQRLSKRISSQINTLQEEHKIFKRPFIMKGVEYLEQMQDESALLEKAFANKFFVDETGTFKPSASK